MWEFHSKGYLNKQVLLCIYMVSACIPSTLGGRKLNSKACVQCYFICMCKIKQCLTFYSDVVKLFHCNGPELVANPYVTWCETASQSDPFFAVVLLLQTSFLLKPICHNTDRIFFRFTSCATRHTPLLVQMWRVTWE